MTNKELDQYINPNSGYGRQKTLMDQQRAAANRNLEVQKKQEQQAAAIQHQKLLKYLPEYQKSMGLKGNGMSETALLDANARYRSEQGRINSEYSARQDAVNEQYRQNLLDLYTRVEAEQKQDRENLYNKAKDAITSWQGSSEELTKYVEGLSGQLDDNDYAILKDVYRGINNGIVAEENAKKLEEAEKEKYQVTDISSFNLKTGGVNNDFTPGDNFYIDIGDEKYKVQLGSEVNAGSDVVKAATKAGVLDGEIFMYDGNLYYVNGGKVHSVAKRYTHDSDNNDYNRLIATLTGNTATVDTNSAPQSGNKQSGNKSTSTNGMVARRMNGI